MTDDAGLGFRDGAYRQQWPFGTSTPNEMSKWVVLKESGVGDLFRDVIERFRDPGRPPLQQRLAWRK